MAKLIIVHKVGNDEEVVLNCDMIVLVKMTTTHRGTYAMIKMVNGEELSVTETTNQLIELSRN
jgi:hypothetical protein